MSGYTGNWPKGGTFGKGYMRHLRAIKREEAEVRNSRAKPERRSTKVTPRVINILRGTKEQQDLAAELAGMVALGTVID